MIKRLIAVALILGLGLIVMPMVPHQTMVTAAEGKVAKERHPAIRAAIRALEKAKYDLEHAAHDFGGHRAAALVAVDNAIKQLHEALEYDKR